MLGGCAHCAPRPYAENFSSIKAIHCSAIAGCSVVDGAKISNHRLRDYANRNRLPLAIPAIRVIPGRSPVYGLLAAVRGTGLTNSTCALTFWILESCAFKIAMKTCI